MSAVLNHDAFQPRAPAHWAPGALLALAVHALLIVAIAFSVNWHSSEPEGVVAELWTATPQIAAPKPTPAVEPPPPTRPVPPARPTPPPPDPAIANAKIATERAAASAARADAAKAEAARQLALARREADAQAKAKAKAETDAKLAKQTDAQAAKRKADEDARLADAKQAAIRQANLRKMMNAAGTSDDANSSGPAARTSGPSASYGGRIKARIKPNIVLMNPLDGDPKATVLVRVGPDGTILGRELEKPSGNATWDEAVLRAIDRTGQLPRDTDGRVPPTMRIEFSPRE